jgi:hypothetical protein
MREYARMWKALRAEVQALCVSTRERMVAGTKEDFDRHKGACQVLQEIEQRMSEIEEAELFGTLPTAGATAEESPNGRRTEQPDTGEC